MIDGVQEFYASDEAIGNPKINLKYLLTQVITGDRNRQYVKQNAQTDSIGPSLKDRLTSLSQDQIIDYTELVLSRLSDDTKAWAEGYTQRALDSLRIITYETLTEPHKTKLFNIYKDTIQDLTPDYDHLGSVTDLMEAGEILFKDYPEERKKILFLVFDTLAFTYQNSAANDKNKDKNNVGGIAAGYIRTHNPFIQKTPDTSVDVQQVEPEVGRVEAEEYPTDLEWLTYSDLSMVINDLKKASGKVSVISPQTVERAAETVLQVLMLFEGELYNKTKYLLTMKVRSGRGHRLAHVSRKLIDYITRLPSLNEPPEGWKGVQELIVETGKRDKIYRRIQSNLEKPVKDALITKYPQLSHDPKMINLAFLWEKMQDPTFGGYGEFKDPVTYKPALYLSPEAIEKILSSLD